MRDIVRHLLADEQGWTLRSCASGQEVVDCVRDFAPDMILLDVSMPGMGGGPVVKALRALPDLDLAAIPIVFFATEAETVDINAFFRLGAADVITKPFDSTTLASFIEEIWREFHAGGARR